MLHNHYKLWHNSCQLFILMSSKSPLRKMLVILDHNFLVYTGSTQCISQSYFSTLKVEILLNYGVKPDFTILIILLNQSYAQKNRIDWITLLFFYGWLNLKSFGQSISQGWTFWSDHTRKYGNFSFLFIGNLKMSWSHSQLLIVGFSSTQCSSIITVTVGPRYFSYQSTSYVLTT